MKQLFLKVITVAFSLIAAFGIFTGCADPKDKDSEAEMITVTDHTGEVNIPKDPKRIVDISGNSDILHILGYSVVGTANSDAYDYTKVPSHLSEILKDAQIVGFSYQEQMDIEKILPLNPDLIIMSTRQQTMHAQLKTLAPTVMIELAQINWEDDVMALANIFKRTQTAQNWLNAYKQKAINTAAQVKEEFGEDTSFFSFLASGDTFYVFDAAGLGSIMYTDMLLNKPNGMPEQENVSLPVVNYEGLAAIESDYIIAIATEADKAKLLSSDIWKNIPAVKNGKVIYLPDPYFAQVYSPIGRGIMLDEFMGLLNQLKK